MEPQGMGLTQITSLVEVFLDHARAGHSAKPISPIANSGFSQEQHRVGGEGGGQCAAPPAGDVGPLPLA
jgi:hypothetical protein